ncbi:hypothetical protein MRX96_049243 [Rhipicephalus microplus]
MASGPTTAADDMLRLQGVVKELLLGTDGSAMERERIAAVMRYRVTVTPLPTAPHVRASTVIANTGAVPRAPDDSAPSPARRLHTSPATPVLETCSRQRSFLNTWKTSAS